MVVDLVSFGRMHHQMGDDAKLKQLYFVFFYSTKNDGLPDQRQQYLLTVSSIVFGLEGNNHLQTGELAII